MFNDLLTQQKNLNRALAKIWTCTLFFLGRSMDTGLNDRQTLYDFQEWQKCHTQLLASEPCIFLLCCPLCFFPKHSHQIYKKRLNIVAKSANSNLASSGRSKTSIAVTIIMRRGTVATITTASSSPLSCQDVFHNEPVSGPRISMLGQDNHNWDLFELSPYPKCRTWMPMRRLSINTGTMSKVEFTKMYLASAEFYVWKIFIYIITI